jgi:hypothetical protein
MRFSRDRRHGKEPSKCSTLSATRERSAFTLGKYEDDDKEMKTVTVLEIPPVDSAQTAVRVAIAAKARTKK